MYRISTDMPNDNMQFRMRRQESERAAQLNRMGTQSRFNELRDDPLAAAHAVRYESYLARLERFENNALYAQDHYRVVDGYMRHNQDIMQRLRELAVTGANGIYDKDQMRDIGIEVNELLKELVQTANALGPDGKHLFAGDKAYTEPFRIEEGVSMEFGEALIQKVHYQGSGSARNAEIDEAAYASLDLSGGEVFWAERMNITSRIDASDFQIKEATSIFVDGVEINLEAGDSVHAIAAKINESPAPVKAFIDPSTRGLSLLGSDAHLIRLEDAASSTVLKDLGILRETSDPYAPVWHQDAQVAGSSLFDVVVSLRDALFNGDSETVGGVVLAGIDGALDNLSARLATLGSRAERAEIAWKRLNAEIPDVTANLARVSSLDFATAATNLGMLDFAHKATMQTATKIIQPTLLDYLR